MEARASDAGWARSRRSTGAPMGTAPPPPARTSRTTRPSRGDVRAAPAVRPTGRPPDAITGTIPARRSASRSASACSHANVLPTARPPASRASPARSRRSIVQARRPLLELAELQPGVVSWIPTRRVGEGLAAASANGYERRAAEGEHTASPRRPYPLRGALLTPFSEDPLTA